ncbi:MAG: putative Ig domain-containing protein, partial [Candidatus Thermoplasmatota archaeon]|nr:putative Ig domain-containing protein [Candidatus Thermoplasmatota archaeon]
SGITLDTSTGVISGTPTQNLTSQLFNIKSCNSLDICDSGQIIMFTIVEPAPNITYPEFFYEVKKDAPIIPIIVTNTGGPIEYFEVSPSLPTGITIDSNGRISGIPVINTNDNYTITAYNSGGSSTTYFEMAVNGTGLYIFYPYDEFNLAINYPIQNEFVPSSQGVAVAFWDISPELPEGLYFSESEGAIWGVPLELRPELEYTVTAVGIDPSLIDSFTISLAVLTDYDADGKPDGDETNTEYWMDIDDDNDNWTDAEEIACSSVPGQYNPLDSNDYPSDIDLDGICDLLDDFDDAPIIMAYPNINLELSLNMPMPAQKPILEGGGILTWEISPELPEGLVFNEYSGVAINLARSNDFAGMISGTPTELIPPTVFTITAQNSMTTASFEITISVLLDTNLDTVPDIYDDDDDGDGWTDEMETLCNSNSLNSSIKPTDTDGDTICDEIDDDDDNDEWIDSEELLCSSDPLNESSIPIFSSPDEPDVCDALLQDSDQDGWSDGMENACGTSSNNSAERPADQDVDGLCDSLDEDDDNDGWLDELDAFPYDDKEWIDTDNDGIGNNEDTDDDNDEWIDSWEDVCSTDPLDNYSTPLDLDGDGFCDVLDQDSDDDGVVDANDAFPDDPSASMDTDGDGYPDTIVGISTSDPPLVEDLDDDNDTWSDKDEIACGTDPLSSIDYPPEGLSCISVDTESTFEFMTYWWCCALLFLLLALLIPLVFLAGEKGNNVLMALGVNVGPQPGNTTFDPAVAVGKGTRREPFVLSPIKGVKMGDSVESKETITITKLQLGTEIRVEDLDSVENENRFSMDLIEVQEDDSEEEGFGSIVFRLQFNDNKAAFGTQKPYGEFIGNIRIGNASVYVTWSVTVVGSPEAIEAAEQEEDNELSAEEEAREKAAEEEAKIKKAEEEAREKAAEEEARIKKAEDDAREKIEREAREKVEAEERIKKAEEEAREKAKEEVKKEAEEKAAAEERIKKAEQEAKEKVESDAQSKLAQMEEQMAAKMAEMEEKLQGLSKKEAELARVEAKAEFIDFDMLGVSESTEIPNEIEKGAKTITLKDASKFPEQGLGYINDSSGENISIKWKAKDGNILTGVSGVKRLISAGSIIFNKDDLQRTKGIGPFIEEKLNALGIYTFLQVSKMDEELEDQVNVAIEFFPGRVKRDQWVNQAKMFVEEDS